jgi:prophage antirepressor-like protein
MTKSNLIHVAVFEGKQIRKILKEDEWWFSVIDVVEVLTGSNIPKRYWSDLKRKLAKEGYSGLYDKIVQLKFALPMGYRGRAHSFSPY